MREPSGGERATSRRLHRLSADESKIVGDLYEDGTSIVEIGDRLGIHRTTVMRHLEQAAVPTRYRKLEDTDVAKCVVRYQAGETCREIAVDFDVHPDTVRRRLLASGVEMREGRFGRRPAT